MHHSAKSSNCYSLYELNEYIRQVLALNFAAPLWVQAEVMQVKFSRGHCYLDLIQKGDDSDEILAQAQAVIWSRQLFALQSKLGSSLESLMQPGTEVQLLVEVTFHERYGLKFTVQDIDESYTLGKLEIQRRKTIEKLHKAGLLERNKLLSLPPVIQRIAVISSAEAAGYKDFIGQLGQNSYGYAFDPVLFPSAMQGVKVVEEISSQLRKIKPEKFDVVVVIRGGGARLDLSAFDDYGLCETVANFPLPVLTGIGHEVDETVLDLVAHRSLKTPTAVAEFLILHNMQFEATLLETGREVQLLTTELLHGQQQGIENIRQLLLAEYRRIVQNQEMMLDFIARELPSATKNLFRTCNQQLDGIEAQLALLDPVAVMKRGFAMVQKNGKVVTSATQLSKGDEMETFFADGKVKSTVN
ncbi:MAG: exodeoxyribonuclease VII large subunit [Saprospirales bacterium]|nr:exodeoxyribonuclease VII large subunit [Saprospirales bacterium]